MSPAFFSNCGFCQRLAEMDVLQRPDIQHVSVDVHFGKKHLVFVLCALFALSAKASTSTPPEIIESQIIRPDGDILVGDLIRAIVDDRKRIRFGHATLIIDYPVTEVAMQSYSDVTKTVEAVFWSTKGWQRQTTMLSHPKWQRQAVTLINAEAAIHDAGGNTLYAVRSSDGEDITARPDVYDLRYLGLMAPMGALVIDERLTTVEQHFETFDPVKAEPTSIGAHKLYRAELQTAGQSKSVAIFDPKYGYNPVQVIHHKEENLSETIKVSYQRVPLGDTSGQNGETIWYPKEVIYSNSVDGRVVFQERIHIESVDFQQSVANDDFSIEALDLPEGRRVLSDGVREMTVDHGQVRPVFSTERMSEDNRSYLINGLGDKLASNNGDMASQERSGAVWKRLLWGVNIAAVLGIIAWVVWQQLWRRK